MRKKKRYLTSRNAEFDHHELQIYEEVACMPPFQRRTLVLIGAQGVGRRSLKNRLLAQHPDRYGTTIPFTSRRPRDDERDGQTYQFVARMDMEMDIKLGCFLEHGEYDGNLYGTKTSSIHEVVNTGRTCILDVNPQSNPEGTVTIQVMYKSKDNKRKKPLGNGIGYPDVKTLFYCSDALKVLRTAEFMPYVVFIAAPEFETLKAMHKAVTDAGFTSSQLTDMELKKRVDESIRIQRAYRHYFDLTIVNDNLDTAFETLQSTLDKLYSEPQWVPVSWVY